MSSLNAVQITAFCYVLECQPRTDLSNAPACTYYVGSTSNVNMRIAQHFNGSGSRFTVAFKPIRVAELDVTPRLTAQEVLAFENETTLRYMQRMMAESPDNPDAWRAGIKAGPPASSAVFCSGLSRRASQSARIPMPERNSV